MGTITSASVAPAVADRGLPESSGEIAVDDVLSSQGVHAPGESQRYWHHQWAVILIVRGGYRVGCDPRRGFDAEVGDMVIMRPETDHAWTTAGNPRGQREGVVGRYVLLRPPPRLEVLLSRRPEIHPHYMLHRIGPGPTWRRIVRCFRQMQAICESSIPGRADLQLNLLEQALLWARAEDRETSGSLDGRVRRAIEHMASHLAEPLTIEDLCRAAGVSRSQLAVIFEPATGHTPMRYLEKLRLERAMQMLRMTSRTVDAIAADVGFCDAKHFARRFRAVIGMTPTAYRGSPAAVGGRGERPHAGEVSGHASH
jgi:AraC-like DNA-binding protein